MSEITIVETIKELEEDVKISDILSSAEEETKNVKVAGLLDDNIAYNTIFIPYKGKRTPLVVTSKAEFLPIKRKKKIFLCKKCLNKMNYLSKPIACDQCEASDSKLILIDSSNWSYFEYDGIKYRFQEEPYFSESLGIKTVNRDVLNIIRKKDTNKTFFNDMVNITQEFWEHIDPELYYITAVFAIQSYLLWYIGKTFYAIPTGVEDTGKSTWQRLLSYIQFNGYFSGAGTVAVSSRLIHYGNISLNQDEFDKMDFKKKLSFIGQANSGFYIDGTYPFTDLNQKDLSRQIKVLNTFAERTFSTNNTFGFDRSFLSRCFIFYCVRQEKKLKDTSIIFEEDSKRFQSIRNEAFVYCLLNWKSIKNDIDSEKEKLEKDGSFGRKNDMYSLILGIVKHFKGDQESDKLKKYLEDRDKVVEDENKSAWESIVFEHIAEKFVSSKDQNISIPSKEIYENLLKKLGYDPSDKESLKEKGVPKPKNVNTILKRHKLLDKPGNSGYTNSGARKYNLNLYQFYNIIKRFGFRIVVENLKDIINDEKYIQSTLSEENASESSVSDKNPQLTDEYKEKLRHLRQNPTFDIYSKIREIKNKGVNEFLDYQAIDYGLNEEMLIEALRNGLLLESPPGKIKIV